MYNECTNLSRGDEGGVALVADALGAGAAASGAPAPAGVEIPEVGAARRAHQLQALPAVMPPEFTRRCGKRGRRWGGKAGGRVGDGVGGGEGGRKGGRVGGGVGWGRYLSRRNAFHPTYTPAMHRRMNEACRPLRKPRHLQ